MNFEKAKEIIKNFNPNFESSLCTEYPSVFVFNPKVDMMNPGDEGLVVVKATGKVMLVIQWINSFAYEEPIAEYPM